MPAGRNDPCPCGSGKKYKKCCLLSTEAARPRRYWADEDEGRALRKLERFIAEESPRQEAQRADRMFWGGVHEELPADVLEEIEGAEHVVAGFRTYLLFDFANPGRETMARRFLASHGGTLQPGERTYLEAMSQSRLSLYEATAVAPGKGMTVVDLWKAGPSIEVREQLGTRQIVPWDLLGLRLLEVEPGLREIHGGCYIYPRDEKSALLASLKRASKALRKEQPGIADSAVDKSFGPLFHQAWLRAIKPHPLPNMVTAEGDAMVFGKALYEVLDEAALRAALAGRADVTVDEEGSSWDWQEPADFGLRSLAQLSLDGARLRVEAHSRRRMERVREWLAALAGAALRHQSTRFESIAQVMKRLPRDRAEPEGQIPLEVQRQILGDWKDQHYRRWLDEPIPALGSRTPRQAVKLKAWRPRVVDLLKGLEVMEARAGLQGKASWDAGWLWEALGLERS